jgi:hypothetical protein
MSFHRPAHEEELDGADGWEKKEIIILLMSFQGPTHEEEELDGADGWEKKEIILLMCFQGHVHEEEELVGADGWEKRRTISLGSQKKKKKKRGGGRRSIYPSAIEKLLRVDEKIVGMSRASAYAASVL